MNVNVVLLAVLDHLVPLQDFRFFLDELIPRDVRSAGIDFGHRDAIIDRANAGAKGAADAIFFANYWPQSFVDFVREFHLFQIDTLVSSIVAGDEAKIALYALIVINPSDRLEAEIEIAKAADARKRRTDEVGA